MKLTYTELLEFLKDKEYCKEEGNDFIVYKTICDYDEDYYKIKGDKVYIVQTSDGMRPATRSLAYSTRDLEYEIIPLDWEIGYNPYIYFTERIPEDTLDKQ